jgi:hypothetical protein
MKASRSSSGTRAAVRRARASSGGSPRCRERRRKGRCRLRDPQRPESLQCTGDFAEAVRDYEAWTVYFEKRRTEGEPWQFKISYTLSWLRGNYPGLFNTDSGQAVPNASTAFDLVSTLVNRFGPLPDDHRHVVKVFGSYELPRKWLGRHGITLGLGFNAESGGPLSVLGAHELYGPGELFVLPRGAGPGRLPWLITGDLFFEYSYQITKDVRIAVSAVVFNFLNRQEALLVDQNYTLDPVCPLRKGQPLTVIPRHRIRVEPGEPAPDPAPVPDPGPAPERVPDPELHHTGAGFLSLDSALPR